MGLMLLHRRNPTRQAQAKNQSRLLLAPPAILPNPAALLRLLPAAVDRALGRARAQIQLLALDRAPTLIQLRALDRAPTLIRAPALDRAAALCPVI